jgi:KipI family sensor histidine kinase inhibitor
MVDIEINPVGDGAAIAVVGREIDAAAVERVWMLAGAIRSSLRHGILDVVPAFGSVLVRFDPMQTDLPRVMAGIRGAAESTAERAARPSRLATIGVLFGGESGIDFEACAHDLGMREARFRDVFCGAEYRVAFLGFVAGFPYLTGLPPALRLPRLSSPRPRVPAGSVAVAAGQCGIYPRQTPGGWRILGRTAAPLFDPLLDPPALLRAGDRVRFEPVADLEEARAIRFESNRA